MVAETKETKRKEKANKINGVRKNELLQFLRKIMLENTGVIIKQQEEDYIAGAIPYEEVCDDWTIYLPKGERQHSIYMDSMACFPYDTEILMEDFSTKRISEIGVGDYVITHKNRKKRVTEVMKRKNEEYLLNIRIKGIYESTYCTKEHPFLTVEGWKKAEELTTDDRVLIPTTKIIKDLTVYEVEKNKDFLWFLGFYLAEGSLGKKQVPKNDDEKLKVNGTGSGEGSITFSMHKDEIEYANKIIKIGKELFGTNFNIRKKKDSNSMDVYGYNLYLRNLLEELGSTSCYKKEINKRLMFLEPKSQLEIARGWLDGDGCYTEKDKRRIVGVSTSEKLIQQVYRILLRNNIKSNLYKRNAYDIHKEAFELRIIGINCNHFTDWNLKDVRQNDTKYPIRRIDRFKDDCLIQKISKIEKVTRNKYGTNTNTLSVYNFEVEDDHSYIVNNVAVHNCVSYSALNIIETQLNYMVLNGFISKEAIKFFSDNGYLKDGHFNFSDRKTRELGVRFFCVFFSWVTIFVVFYYSV